jgi:hypothetical protein
LKIRLKTRLEIADWAGKELYSILKLLAVPALFVLSIIVFKLHPGKIGLYGFALVFGLLLLVQLRKGPEPLLALVIIYYPLSKLYPVLIAPGINGTNLLELFLISFWVIHAYKNKERCSAPCRSRDLVGIWFFLSVISVLRQFIILGCIHSSGTIFCRFGDFSTSLLFSFWSST